jgi:O-antigen/teichoic acid export membrane protein
MADPPPPSPAGAPAVSAEVGAASPRREDSVGRSLAFLTAANGFQQVSAFVLSIALRAILGPAKTGVWNLVEVWRQQLSSISLGAAQSADRDMPMLRARSQHAEEAEVRSVAFSFTMGEASAVALGFLIYWVVQRDTFEPSLALGLALAPLMALLTSYVSLYQLFLKNLKEFRLYSILFIAQALVDWSMLPLVLIGGLDALLVGLAIGWILRAAIYWGAVRRRRLFRLRLTLRRAVLFPMLRFGILLSIVGLMNQLLLRLDSLVIGISLGTTALGYYYLGPQVAAAAAAVPLSLAVIAWPNLMETYGRDGREGMIPHLERYLRPVGLVISPAAAAVGVFGLGVLVTGFLPEFSPGLDAMQVWLLTVVFVQSIALLHQALIAVRRVMLLIALTTAAVVVQATILALGSIGELSLTTAAWSAVAGQATLALTLLVASGRLLGFHRADVARFWGRVPLAWALLIAVIVAIDRTAPDADGLVGALAVATVQLLVFLAVAVVVLGVLDRKALSETLVLFRGMG